MLEVVMAILSGGATGILGVIFQRLFDGWKLKQELDQLREKNSHEREMKKIDADIMREEWTQRVKVAEVESDAVKDKAESEAFAASFATEPKRYSEGVQVGKFGAFMLVLADVTRAIVRPGLTLYLAWIAKKLMDQNTALMAVLNLAENVEVVSAMHKQITLTLLYLFTTCVCWWFGTRTRQSAPKAA